jgi:hypothetical protein
MWNVRCAWQGGRSDGVAEAMVWSKRWWITLSAKRETKTYNSGDSLVVTHLTTNPPVSCLNRAERTGSLVLKILWSYVDEL